MMKKVRSSASKKHLIIQKHLENVISNLPTPKGWILQVLSLEDKECDQNYNPDIFVQWVKKTGGKYKLYIEIQKNFKEPSFMEKMKVYSKMVVQRKIFSYMLVDEDIAPRDIFELDDWLEEQLLMNVPW